MGVWVDELRRTVKRGGGTSAAGVGADEDEGAQTPQLCDVVQVLWGGPRVVQGDALEVGEACCDAWQVLGVVKREVDEMMVDDV